MSGHIQHRDLGPVFVMGHSRSGTSILTGLVRQHLEIAFGTESQFIPQFAKVAARHNLHTESGRARFLEVMGRERFFDRTRKNYKFQLDVPVAAKAAEAGTYRAVLEAVFQQLALQMGYPRWGDKTPGYALHLPLLYSLFPEARFVHVVRDGRDVALSLFQTQFGAKNAFTAAHSWRKRLDAVAAFQRMHPQAHLLELRYEDLLSKPDDVFRRLVGFLGVRDDTGTLGAQIGAQVRASLRSGNSHKWKHRMSGDEQRLFECVAGPWLTHYGYERANPEAKPLGMLARTHWTIDDRLKRMRIAGYWTDTMYRIGLRLGPVGQPLRAFGKFASRGSKAC